MLSSSLFIIIYEIAVSKKYISLLVEFMYKKEPSKRKALTVAWQRSSLTGRKPNYIRR